MRILIPADVIYADIAFYMGWIAMGWIVEFDIKMCEHIVAFDCMVRSVDAGVVEVGLFIESEGAVSFISIGEVEIGYIEFEGVDSLRGVSVEIEMNREVGFAFVEDR